MKPVRHTQEMIDRYVREGLWGRPSLDAVWDRNAELYPDQEAAVDSHTRVTWSQAKVLTDRLARAFRTLGLKKDDVVALQLPNSVEWALIRVALLKARLIVMPVLMFFRQSELLQALRVTDAAAVVTCGEHRGFDYAAMVMDMRSELPRLRHHVIVAAQERPGTIALRSLMDASLERSGATDDLREPPFAPGEVTMLGMTSGTTGTPKIVEAPEDALRLLSEVSVRRWQLSSDDILLALAPVAGGASGGPCILAAPHAGAKVVLMERFEPGEALALIERERVTIATGVPAQMAMMVKHPSLPTRDLSSLRAFFYAGAVCLPALADEVEEKMGCRILTRFSMYDAGVVTATCYDDPPHVRRYSVGKPLDHGELRLLDVNGLEVPRGEVGEVVFRGPACMGGFHKDLQRTMEAWGASDGWYHSGDLACLDDDGNMRVVGRKKDVIIRGGQNIYPVEVESLLLTHPKVSSVAVVAMPDAVMGEKACAFVVPKAGAQITLEEMTTFLREEKQIAPYKLPERLELVESFPLGSDGQKVLKHLLADQVRRKLEAERAG